MSRLPQACMALAVMLVCLGGGLREAAACSCVLPDNAGRMTKKELDAWHFERAQTIVSGRVTEVHAGDGVTRSDRRVVVAKLKVASVLKGDAPVGEMTLLTGFGNGDCGLAVALLVAASGDTDLEVEVEKVPEFPNEYAVNMCGYGKLAAVRKH